MKKFRLLVLLFTLVSLPGFGQWQQDLQQAAPAVRVFANASLNDIAMATFDQGGPVIYYNPMLCQQAGDLATAFMMTHEVGHHNLNQAVQMSGNPLAQLWLNMNQENAADAFAVEFWVARGNKLIIQSGAMFMWNVNNMGDSTHPPSRMRANNIAANYQRLTGMSLFP
ncbi:M48 family metalloprotease [Hymenobacter rigui]|uniref:Peptidase M48 domain-containing protein n=1 Tax=Hymenobacter rigui TaxID=334424 RepID=A0A428KU36_9BACT|nr:hypothetical protein [Hymenobacter rigui]RSK50092.1 hypothetical protein EI291_05425 [Hymenobacter rigui]